MIILFCVDVVHPFLIMLVFRRITLALASLGRLSKDKGFLQAEAPAFGLFN